MQIAHWIDALSFTLFTLINKIKNTQFVKVPMTRKFLLYLKEHEKISKLAVYSNTISLLVAKLSTKI